MNRTIQYDDKNRSYVAYINLHIYTSSAVKWLMTSSNLAYHSCVVSLQQIFPNLLLVLNQKIESKFLYF